MASTLLTLGVPSESKTMFLFHLATTHDGDTVNKVQKVFHAIKVIKPSHKVKSRWRRGLLERIKSLSQVMKPRPLFQGSHCILCLQRETVQLALLLLLMMLKRIFEIV